MTLPIYIYVAKLMTQSNTFATWHTFYFYLEFKLSEESNLHHEANLALQCEFLLVSTKLYVTVMLQLIDEKNDRLLENFY